VLAPRYFGLFSPAGDLLGWFSLTFTLGRPDMATLGIVVREPWRDRGIGTAATRHAVALKDSLLSRPVRTLLETTKASNGRVLRIVQNECWVFCYPEPCTHETNTTAITSPRACAE
jgi:hypothetical protein